MREQNFTVTEHGQIVEQVRYVTLTASVRLTVRQAQVFNDNLQVDFGSAGWASVRNAIAIRHRVTHPKRPQDLLISREDLDTTKLAFQWLLAVIEHVLTSALQAHGRFNVDMRDLLEALKRGDPAALQEYEDVIREMDLD